MTLTKLPLDEYLDLPAHRGQRVESYSFLRVNGVTGEILSELNPTRGSVPQLSHDTTASTKRRLTMQLGAAQTADVDVLTDRVLPVLTVGGVAWPLGRYMFTDASEDESTGGDRGQYTLLDEGFAIDQVLETSFTRTGNVASAIRDLISTVSGLAPVPPVIEGTNYTASGSFSPGQTRGNGLDAYAQQGDYFPYWMDHLQRFHMIRTFDPATVVPDLDFDAGGKVVRSSISRTSNVLTAANRFVVVSTAADAASNAQLVGTYDVPSTAPFSFARRGFRIVDYYQGQYLSVAQANAAARQRGMMAGVYELITVNTAVDPRHDSYNVVRFRGDNWLELAWSMELRAGGTMQHTIRKAYGA